MTNRPDRVVTIYTMIPSVAKQDTDSRVCTHIRERFTRLTRRHDRSRSIIGSALLADSERIDLMEEARVDVEAWFRNGDLASTFGSGDEADAAAAMALLEKHREHAEALPIPLHSALVSSRFPGPRVAVLFEYEGVFTLIVFNPRAGKIESLSQTEILALIRCDPDTSPALVRLAEVEHVANAAVRRWCEETDAEIERVKKTVAVYLQPSDDAIGSRQLLMDDGGDHSADRVSS
jgi:hypothetical protein